MQSALRLAARRAACAGSRRGVASTTKAAADTVAGEAEREWVSALVQREVRAAKEEEALARKAAIVGGYGEWMRGFKTGFGSCFLGCAYLAVYNYILSRC